MTTGEIREPSNAMPFEEAVDALGSASRTVPYEQQGVVQAITGVGWALLAVSEAIREGQQ